MRVALCAALLLASASSAEPYLALRGGTQSWGATSNSDELESGTEWGHALALAVGDEAGLSDVGLPKSDFALDLELEATWRREALHGRNRGQEHRTADGRDLDVVTLAAHLWPGWQVTRWLTLSAGGGGGLGYARAFGDGDPTWSAHVGAGARANLTPELSLELSERTAWMGDPRLDGYRLDYGPVHGVLLGVRLEFKQ